jgi:hypothetical protein
VGGDACGQIRIMLKKFAESVAKTDASAWTAGQGKATRPIADPRRPG